MSTITILTGANRGLGAAMAEQLVRAGQHLVTLSRQPTPGLEELARACGATLTHVPVDLGNQAAVEDVADRITALLAGHDRARLIHNAGIVAPVKQSADLTDFNEIRQAFLVNIETPIFLTAHFLKCTSHTTDRRVMLISSGAGRSPTSGWAVYCATKAALDRYAQVVQQDCGTTARVVSMAPGIVDTGMQAQLRSSRAEDFPAIERFIGFHKQQQLAPADTTASRLLTLLERDDFGTNTLDDVREHTF